MNLIFSSLEDEPRDILRLMRLSRRISQLDLSLTAGYHANTVGTWEKNGLYSVNALFDFAEALGYDVQISLIDKKTSGENKR